MSRYTLTSGAHQRTGRPTHAGTNIPASPASLGHRRRKMPEFILQDVDDQRVDSPNLTMSRFSRRCGRARGDKTPQTRSDLKTNSSADTKTLEKVQRLSSSSSTFALRPSLPAKSWAFFQLPSLRGSKQDEFQERLCEALF